MCRGSEREQGKGKFPYTMTFLWNAKGGEGEKILWLLNARLCGFQKKRNRKWKRLTVHRRTQTL